MKIKILSSVIMGLSLAGSGLVIAQPKNLNSVKPSSEPAETPEDWYSQGAETAAENMEIARHAASTANKMAKNVIVFLGDGMGISTLTAARIYEGQLDPEVDGEEHELFFERFPNVALSKTYTVNAQTPDSAGTMSAIMTGYKTNSGAIAVNQYAIDCDSNFGNETWTALELAEMEGMSTGVISTARITHATPASTYAHIYTRGMEDDHDKRTADAECTDIALQMLEMPENVPGSDGLEVVLGGGVRGFLPRGDEDDPTADPLPSPLPGRFAGRRGERDDQRDLTDEWLDDYENSAFVYNKAGLDAVNAKKVDHLMGLFTNSHMAYEADRDEVEEPSLAEMTGKAIEILETNKRGYMLVVEGGRIDHAHHETNPYRALTDAVAFAAAVQEAYENTDPRETLIIVTADHSHVMTLAGYPARGNKILDVVRDANGVAAEDCFFCEGMPYTTIGYVNGLGFTDPAAPDVRIVGRVDLTGIDTTHPDFHSETLSNNFETHGAEDVAIFATGPGSSLINGMIEQNVIFHVINAATSLTD